MNKNLINMTLLYLILRKITSEQVKILQIFVLNLYKKTETENFSKFLISAFYINSKKEIYFYIVYVDIPVVSSVVLFDGFILDFKYTYSSFIIF